MSDAHELPAVVPMLAYEDPASAIEWLAGAFGFAERIDQRYTEPDGRVSHAELSARDGLVMVANPTPDYRNPRNHRATCAESDRWLSAPWIIDGVLVHVDDVDAHFAWARDAGAAMLSEIESTPHGKLYRVEDLEGHRWMFMESRRA